MQEKNYSMETHSLRMKIYLQAMDSNLPEAWTKIFDTDFPKLSFTPINFWYLFHLNVVKNDEELYQWRISFVSKTFHCGNYLWYVHDGCWNPQYSLLKFENPREMTSFDADGLVYGIKRLIAHFAVYYHRISGASSINLLNDSSFSYI